MLTNIIATIVVAVVTNTYAPKQYLDSSYGCLVYGCTQDHSVWRDATDGITFCGTPVIGLESRTRDNPDVRITEVREVKTLSFEIDGRTWSAEVSSIVISTSREKRVVTTSERWTNE